MGRRRCKAVLKLGSGSEEVRFAVFGENKTKVSHIECGGHCLPGAVTHIGKLGQGFDKVGIIHFSFIQFDIIEGLKFKL